MKQLVTGSILCSIFTCMLLVSCRTDGVAKNNCTPGKLIDGPNGSKFAQICPGTFMMGSPDSELGRGSGEVQHQVTISEAYEIQTTEVTQSQWEAEMDYNRSDLKGPDLPVENVSWNGAQAFIMKLNAKVDGYFYSLPSEAEWEYAARAGTTGAYAGDLDAMAWYIQNSGNTSHPVATKKPNDWGLYDMHGNVSEWTGDRLGSSHFDYRKIRGGSWSSTAEFCRSAFSASYEDVDANSDLGFRLVRKIR